MKSAVAQNLKDMIRSVGAALNPLSSHMADKETTDREDKLDETIEETFPASDTPGNTTETGIRLSIGAADEGEIKVRVNPDAHRFEIAVDEQIAFLQYQRKQDAIVLVHTAVPPSLRGRGLAGILAKAALQTARAEGLRAFALCPLVKGYVRKHPEFQTLLA